MSQAAKVKKGYCSDEISGMFFFFCTAFRFSQLKVSLTFGPNVYPSRTLKVVDIVDRFPNI